MTRTILEGHGRRTRDGGDSDEAHWEEHQCTVAYRPQKGDDSNRADRKVPHIFSVGSGENVANGPLLLF